MNAPTTAERALYADLTALLMQMKEEPLVRVEAAIEERFQAFVRTEHPGGSTRLQITQTYTLHDDAEPWVEYRTEYSVAAATPVPGIVAPTQPFRTSPFGLRAANDGNVVPFPRPLVAGPSGRTAALDIAHPGGGA